MNRGGFNHGHMPAKAPRKRPERPVKPLFIGQWLKALRLQQRKVAKEAGINEGYFSELISGKNKTNPSNAVVFAIAEAMGIPWHVLYQPPPDKEFLQKAFTLDPAVLLRLMPPKPPYGN